VLTVCQEAEAQASSQFTLRDPLHGREILAACAIKGENSTTIVITGSEDTVLKVSRYEDQELYPMVTFSNHVASIRALAKVRLPGSRYIVMSAGSRMQAQLYHADLSQGFEMSHFCHYFKNYEHDQEQDFRIMSAALLKDMD
jgi:hypothetical protein